MKPKPDQFELQIKIDAKGHASLFLEAESFQQLRNAIIALADFLQGPAAPATALNLKAGQLERRT